MWAELAVVAIANFLSELKLVRSSVIEETTEIDTDATIAGASVLDDGGQEVPHLHLHLLGGRRLGAMAGKS